MPAYQDIDLAMLKELIGKLQNMHVTFEEAVNTIANKSDLSSSDHRRVRLMVQQLQTHQVDVSNTIDELGGPAFLISRLAAKFLIAAADELGQQVLVNSQHLFHPLPKIDQDELLRRMRER
jgi:copper homeostasis protein CutC